MPISPGTYLRLRREAAGLSRDDLALMLETDPPVAAHRRAEWLGLIEADEMPIGAATIDALDNLAAAGVPLDFDRVVLRQLGENHYHASTLPAPQVCRGCGCSEFDPCIGRDNGGDACAWVAEDLCSECVDRVEARAA